MKLPLKFWLFVGWTTTAAGIDSPARDAWGPTGTNIIPTAAEFDTHAKHYEHHDDTTTSDSKDDKKARTSRSRSSTPAGEPHGFQGNEYDHDQDSMQSEYYEQKRWEDDEEVSTFQLAPSTSVLWPGIATMVSMTAGFDEFAPGEAPAWFWAMVDQGQELVRDGADGERLGPCCCRPSWTSTTANSWLTWTSTTTASSGRSTRSSPDTTLADISSHVKTQKVADTSTRWSARSSTTGYMETV